MFNFQRGIKLTKTDLEFFLKENIILDLNSFLSSLIAATVLSLLIQFFYLRYSSTLSNKFNNKVRPNNIYPKGIKNNFEEFENFLKSYNKNLFFISGDVAAIYNRSHTFCSKNQNVTYNNTESRLVTPTNVSIYQHELCGMGRHTLVW